MTFLSTVRATVCPTPLTGLLPQPCLPANLVGHQDWPRGGRLMQSHQTSYSEGPTLGVLLSAIADCRLDILHDLIFERVL